MRNLRDDEMTAGGLISPMLGTNLIKQATLTTEEIRDAPQSQDTICWDIADAARDKALRAVLADIARTPDALGWAIHQELQRLLDAAGIKGE